MDPHVPVKVGQRRTRVGSVEPNARIALAGFGRWPTKVTEIKQAPSSSAFLFLGAVV
jgi:hypothetical protein